jgi:hypothetical protein
MMLSKEQKKEAISQFKERKALLGVYVVRCTASGQAWVGASRNLDATRNGIWFSLRQRAHREISLQEAWDAHGEPAFEYQALEKLDEDTSPLLIPNLLKEAKQRWMTQLDARGLL